MTPADYEAEALLSAPGAGCPNAAKLGTVEIESPLIKPVIHGSLYIAEPFENPSGSLLALVNKSSIAFSRRIVCRSASRFGSCA